MEFELIRSRRKTISIHVTRDCVVQVRAPKSLSNKQIQTFLDEKALWIEKNLAIMAEAQAQNPKLTEEELHALLSAAQQDFGFRCARIAPIVGVTYHRISIRHQLTRWGSCSAKGNLSFNCLLMLASEDVRDYVVVHELCHRKHMNHSADFWNEVGSVLPDYRIRRQWLKEHAAALVSRLP